MNDIKNRKMIVFLSGASALVIIGVLVLSFYLTRMNFTKEHKITDFQKFKHIENIPDSIVVTFKDEYDGTFEISNVAQIKEIHDLLLARIYVRADPPAPGTNCHMKFVYSDGKTISLGTRILTVKNKHYVPSKYDSLDYILQTIGLAEGKLIERIIQ
ncbi:MAG: hypothetical protein LBE09_06075 [Christensenellaceae bacterium]|jgi:hypothetical protein|nr:hypothetical protein [Christensenellaceae bacterium]